MHVLLFDELFEIHEEQQKIKKTFLVMMIMKKNLSRPPIPLRFLKMLLIKSTTKKRR